MVVTVPIAVWLLFAAAGGGYVPLVSDLAQDQALTIQHELAQRHVPCRIQDGGRTIMVAAALRAELIIEYSRVPANGTPMRQKVRTYSWTSCVNWFEE